MRIKIVEISVKNIIIDNVKALYESAFPANERRDCDKLLSLVEENPFFHLYAFTEDDAFTGFLSCWNWGDCRYFEHFAVEPAFRNGGRGAKYLQSVVEMELSPVILEVEPPVDEMAQRRIGFYQRNGFKLWSDISYIQPPYSADKESVELKLMTFGNISLTGEDDERILRIKKDVYGV